MFKRKAKTYKYTVDNTGYKTRGSVRWHILGYFLLFALIMLVLLWLMQTVFLESIYKSIKTHDIESTSVHIAKTLETGGMTGEEMEEYLNWVAHEGSLCVRVVDMSNEGDGLFVLQTSEATPGCMVHHLSAKDMLILAKAAEEAGGSMFYNLGAKNEAETEADGFAQLLGEQYARMTRVYAKQADIPPLLLSIRCVTMPGGERYAILLNGAISPVSATVDTLRMQLVLISGVMVLMGLLLALIATRRLSRPLEQITRLSRRLAAGDFNIDFRQPGAYREVDELAATLNYAANELGKTERLQQDLIANISHDLRTPLTLITGYAEAMRDLPGENTPENVQVIIDETERLGNLVNDLLDMSKLQAGVVQLDREELELTELIREIMLRFNKLCAAKGYTIDFVPTARIWVQADKLKLTQVIYNLLNNAITYTGDDMRVIIKQQLLHRDRRVRVEVIDTGEGIKPEQIKNIWQRYYHGSANHRRTNAGNGLGLYIVKQILDMHGGAYGVESTPGKGSCFWFEIEVSRTEEMPPKVLPQ